jgi:hypothetical protein
MTNCSRIAGAGCTHGALLEPGTIESLELAENGLGARLDVRAIAARKVLTAQYQERRFCGPRICLGPASRFAA